MTTTTASPTFAFAIEALRQSPDASYADLKARAELEGWNLIPIVYGRARAQLGLVTSKPKVAQPEEPVLAQVEGVALEAALPAVVAEPPKADATLRSLHPALAPATAEPPRLNIPAPRPRTPRETPAAAPGPLEQLLSHIQALEAENQRLRTALEQIQAVVEWVG